MLNGKDELITIDLNRTEILDLMKACDCLSTHDGDKWAELYVEIKKQLDSYDEICLEMEGLKNE